MSLFDRSQRWLRSFFVLLVVLSTSMYPANIAAAQLTTAASAQDWSAEGLLDGSSREFIARDLHNGTIYLSFAVVEFDSVANAEGGIDPIVDAILENLTANGFTFSAFPTAAPSVRESTLAYEGTTVIEGYTLDTAILVFRDGRYLHSWIAWGQGFAANPLLDLAKIADQFYRDVPPSYESTKAAKLLDLVPALSDLPPGLVLAIETEDLAASWSSAP